MAMQTNLSKKDKFTIAIVLFAGLAFALIWFLIRPTITSIITINDEIEQAEITQTEYKNKIMFLSSAEAIYGKAVEDLNESTADFYPVMDSSEVDRMVTSYVLESGLFAENLLIRMPSGAVVEAPYAYAEVAQTGAAPVVSDDGSDDGSDADADTATAVGSSDLLSPYSNARNNARSTEPSGVQCASVTLVVTGSRSTCQAFIDDMCTKPAMRITGYSWSRVDMVEQYNPRTNTVELVDPGIVRLQISFNLYMADVTDYDAAVTDAVNDAVADSEG